MKTFLRTVTLAVIFTFVITINEYYHITAESVNQSQSISYSEKTIKTTTGAKKVKVITVDPKSPDISFEVNTPDSRLNVTQDFGEQIKSKKPFAAINANFFAAYETIKDPIGHVMVDGKLIYAQSGLISLGITKDKDLIFSVPGIFTRMFGEDKKSNTMRSDGTAYYNVWSAYEINTRSQNENVSIMYTPARGSYITITSNGYVATVRNGILDSFKKVTPSTIVTIPKDGYVTFFGQKIVQGWKGDNGLHEGRSISTEYYLFNNTNKEFKLEDMQWMLTGGPELVVGGKIAPVSKNPIFSGTRFTTLSTSRTAIGLTETGQLLIVSASVRINELKQIMLTLGCQEAINLDGGASAAMYYNGKTLVKPGRKLTTVLYIYKK